MCVDQLKKFLAGFEVWNFLRRDFDPSTGFWIAAYACSSLARAKAAEVADLNFIAAVERAHDRIEHQFHNIGGFVPRNLCRAGNFHNQIRLREDCTFGFTRLRRWFVPVYIDHGLILIRETTSGQCA
jgi:hypothetical protein